jgi:hypothetical protein
VVSRLAAEVAGALLAFAGTTPKGREENDEAADSHHSSSGSADPGSPGRDLWTGLSTGGTVRQLQHGFGGDDSEPERSAVHQQPLRFRCYNGATRDALPHAGVLTESFDA